MASDGPLHIQVSEKRGRTLPIVFGTLPLSFLCILTFCPLCAHIQIFCTQPQPSA